MGGATRNEFWMQNKADVAGRPIEVPDVEEATPLGAAILAGIGVGLYRDERDAFERVYKPGKTFEPGTVAIESRSLTAVKNLSAAVQVVLLTDRAEIVDWARILTPEQARCSVIEMAMA